MMTKALPPPAWMSKAACVGIDPEVWFPDHNARVGLRIAQKICLRCPVQEACGDFAARNQIEHGVWGGVMQTR